MKSTDQVQFLNRVQDHKGIIEKVLWLYVDREEDRKDVRQEILLQAWRTFANFKQNAAFSTWLYRVALNTALTFFKKQQKAPTLSTEQVADVGYQPEFANNETELLYKAIKQLGQAERLIITLHLDGYGNDEIAQISGISANNVGVKLHRIKKQLVQQLQPVS